MYNELFWVEKGSRRETVTDVAAVKESLDRSIGSLVLIAAGSAF